MTALTRILLGLFMMVATCAAASAADRVIVILDASGSMWGQIDGKPKLEIARQSLKTVLQAVPGDEEIGFMAYGHRQKGSCDDIELIVPPQAGSASAISTAADNLKFLGKTPLSAAVRQAAEALKYTEDKARVILITDGLETCNADPCQLGKELEAAGVDFTADVVGFGLTAEEGRQVACLAENTGGKYIQASDEAALKDALVETVAAQPVPEPAPEPESAPEPAKVEFNFAPTLALSEDTEDLGDEGQSWNFFKAKADGTRGEDVGTEYNAWKGNLEAGDYIVTARFGRAETEQRVTIEDGKLSEPHFILNAGTLVIRPLGAEGEQPRDSATVNFTYPGGDATEYGETKVVVPAGEQKVTVTIGKGVATEEFTLEAGKKIEKTIIAGVGHVVANAFYKEGMKVDAGGLAVRVFKAAKRIDGTREDVTYGYGPDTAYDLPPGEYVLFAELHAAKAEAPFTVRVAERTEANVVLDAGVLAISASGAKETRVFKAAKDIQGDLESVWYSYDEESQTTLNAGDYVVVATRGDDNVKSEMNVTITAGERAEIKIP